MSDVKERAEEALRKFRKADRLSRKRPIDWSESVLNPIEAARERDEGERLLAAPAALTGAAHTELLATPEPEKPLSQRRLELLETLREPNVISVAASDQRASLASRAGILPAAVDAAVSAGAEGPIEKMLCHQLAAAHASGMVLMERLQDVPVADAARLANAAARMFEVYQGGVLALQKLKLGGAHHVVVQHQQVVKVESGAQAVVAGQVQRGAPGKRRQKNGR